MALGLAVDIAKQGWNQGDDLFAYMNHRLAAGIEYVAAQTQSVEGLPWVNYHYGSNGYYYTDSRAWLMEGPALGAQMRPYWGSVIGIYEGVKGVKMPFSEVSYKNMGIDEGGQGGTSGGYDHLGYSVLMNTRDEQLCPADQVPTELTPKMEYSGTLTANLIPSLAQEKTCGLVNGKTLNNNTCVPAGRTLTLMPQLPEGEEDTGQWQWNTGETTRDITVTTDKSFIYRVTYTNKNGIESQLCFPIAAKGDCTPEGLTPSVAYDGSSAETNTIDVLYGKTATLSVTPSTGWGTYKWSTGATTQSITTAAIRKDQDITVTYTNQGGATTTEVFHIHVLMAIPYYTVGETTTDGAEAVVEQGGSVTLGLTTPSAISASKVSWSDGTTGSKTLTLENLQSSDEYTATFTLAGENLTFTFLVFVKAAEYYQRLVDSGNNKSNDLFTLSNYYLGIASGMISLLPPKGRRGSSIPMAHAMPLLTCPTASVSAPPPNLSDRSSFPSALTQLSAPTVMHFTLAPQRATSNIGQLTMMVQSSPPIPASPLFPFVLFTSIMPME